MPMPCGRLKNTFIHRLFLCYYCTPEDERPKQKVRPGKGSSEQQLNRGNGDNNFASTETQTNNSVPSSGYAAVQQCSTNNNNNNYQLRRTPSYKISGDQSDQGGGGAAITSSSPSPSEDAPVTPEVLMTWVNEVLSESLVQEVNAVYKFVIVDDNSKSQSIYYLDLKNGRGSVGQGNPPLEEDVVLTSSLRNMQLLMNGKLSKVSAFLTGRLKVEGDKNAAYNLDKVISLVQQS